MSDQQQQPAEQPPAENVTEPQFECATCGVNGGFGTTCPDCKRPIEQPRQFTLSEIRSGRAPAHNPERPSGAAPLIVQVPGSDPGRH
jgi:hypothetical protein